MVQKVFGLCGLYSAEADEPLQTRKERDENARTNFEKHPQTRRRKGARLKREGCKIEGEKRRVTRKMQEAEGGI